MKIRIKIAPPLWILGSVLLAGPDALGFDDRDTHPRITERAARQSTLDAVLRNELNIAGGIQASLRGPSNAIQEGFRWLRDGAQFEDRPTCRAVNHFHDPLKPFTSSRVTDEPLLDIVCSAFAPIRSNVTWGTGYVSPTDRGPATGNPFAWDAARRAFANALTLPTPSEREVALSQTLESLGHAMHLVQDLAVPAHVRNDFRSHLANLRLSSSRPAEEGFERFVRVNSALVDEAAPVTVTISDRPVTRFWDVDRYSGSNPSSDTEQGLAEYTNANFVSLNTILAEDLHPYPRLSSTNADALFGKAASVVRHVRAEDGRVDAGLYLDKVRDGETLTNFLRAGYLTGDFIDKAAPGTSRALVFQLDDEVHRNHAALLVPRALGYSKALLDYFFRGRLDVDLVDDGSGLRLAGTNASVDTLTDGSLAVYADGPDGLRRPASTAVTVGRVDPGGAIPPVSVDPSEGAERFVAVYAGALGQERAADPDPGAVIGKVLGGYRVEQVFADATRWNLRTPRGIFPLPILRSDIVDLRWGDADNTLVGRTAFGLSGQPNRLRAYRLARPVGSADVPLRAAQDGGQEVDVLPIADAAFPFGVDAGGLRLNSTIDYQQYLISFVRTTVVSNGALVSDVYSDGKIERVVSQKAPASFDWRMTLDLAHFNTFRARPYTWQLQQIGLTTDGRIVALVRIELTQLDTNRPESFAVFPSKRFAWCGGSTCPTPPDIQDGPPARVVYGFGSGAATHWALVDVSAGAIVHSTAAEGVIIDNVIRQTHFTEPVVGGAPNGLAATEIHLHINDDPGNAFSFYPVDGQGNLRIGTSCGPGDHSGHYEVGRVEVSVGVTTASASQYPEELASVAFTPSPERLITQQQACLAALVGISPSALVTATLDEARVFLNDAVTAVRVPDGTERMVFLFELPQGPNTNSGGSLARVVSWDPLAGSASLRHEILSGDHGQLVSAAHGLALMQGGSNSPALSLVPLEGEMPAASFPMASADAASFRALSPAFLYNVGDSKFYRYQPDLLRTALPAPLAAGAPVGGDYHAIRLP